MSPALPGNLLIAGLPRAERREVLAHCTQVPLRLDVLLCSALLRQHSAYFPVSGSISVLASVSNLPPLEVGIIGTEGMLGASVALGVRLAPYAARGRSLGSAYSIPVGRLLPLLPACPMLARGLRRQLSRQLAYLAQAVVCARFHEAEQRLARCLLQSHDHSGGRAIRLTHQRLGDLLGVQRSAVSIAANKLQRLGLIDYSRGEIVVRDRPRLEAASCECYQAGREFDRQFTPGLGPGEADDALPPTGAVN